MDGGERAVLFDRFRGVLPKTKGEGTHFLIPILQRPYVMDVRTRPRSLSSITGTKGTKKQSHLNHGRFFSDLQMVNMTVRVLSKPNEKTLPTIFQVSVLKPARYSFCRIWVWIGMKESCRP